MPFSLKTLVVLRLGLLFLFSLEGQDIYQLAENMACAGLYEQASTEYLRFIFFNPKSDFLSRAYLKLAYCALHLKDFAKAEKYLKLAQENAKSEEEKIDLLFKQLVFYLGRDRLTDTKYILTKLEGLCLKEENDQQKLFFKALLEVLEFDFEEAFRLFKLYFSQTEVFPNSTEEAVIEILTQASNAKPKDPGWAIFFSLILPGLGQVYAEKPGEGLLSFLVTGSAATLVIYTLLNGDYLNALMAGLFVFLRFYEGSLYYAERYVSEYNYLQAKTWQEKILQLLRQK